MAKYKKVYHDGLTKESVNHMTVYRLTVVWPFTHTVYPGEVHQHYFEENGALLYTYLTDTIDTNWLSIKIEKL